MEDNSKILWEVCRIIASIGITLIGINVLGIVNWSDVVIYIVAILTILAGLGWVYIGMKNSKK